MKKVPASKCPGSEYGSICICKAGIDPSEPCVHLGNLYSRNFKKKNIEKGKLNMRIDSKKEGEGMLTRLLKHHGVSVTTMKQVRTFTVYILNSFTIPSLKSCDIYVTYHLQKVSRQYTAFCCEL
jgi:hypothetical protein